ncbi:hypothetical protein GA0115241_100873 [Streptomyces sp. DpondAA-D4]|nr:hypothetical protein GA0115241_100873 [Streptomyces sp. DpondAA-D4]
MSRATGRSANSSATATPGPVNSRSGDSRSRHRPPSGSVSAVSRQPPSSESRSDSRVTAVTTSPDRQNARQCSAAGPRAATGA